MRPIGVSVASYRTVPDHTIVRLLIAIFALILEHINPIMIQSVTKCNRLKNEP